MRIKIIIIMSLSILLSSSSFFLVDYLNEKLNNGQYNDEELAYALELKLDAAYRVKLLLLEANIASNIEPNRQLWLGYANKLAKRDGHVSLKLAEYYLNQGQISKGISWYQQAVNLKEQRAVLPLAKLYFENDQLEPARKTLFQTQVKSTENLLLAVEVAIAQGDILFIHKQLERLKVTDKGQLLLAKIRQYQILANDDVVTVTDNKAKHLTSRSCKTSLQLFATTLADLERVTQFKQKFTDHALSEYLCLTEPKYVPINKLNCEHNKDNAITCEEGVWQSVAENINTNYLGLLYPYGGANVHLGILYFDRQDAFDVFSHEVSHLLGFVDEYPLAKDHPRCRQVQNEMFAQNIAVIDKYYYGKRAKVRREVLKTVSWAKMIKTSTPILMPVEVLHNKKLKKDDNKGRYQESAWLLGTPKTFKNEVGIFNADTCQTTKYRAYKPLSTASQLQYYQLSFPAEYFKLLSEQNGQFYMPSFHYNIAMSLLSTDEFEQGKSWLMKAIEFEDINARKLKVLQGKF